MIFIPLDYETANQDRHSICQVGLCLVENCQIIDSFSTMINPEMEFAKSNFAVKRHDPDSVAECITLKEVFPIILNFLDGAIVVSHSDFDKQVTEKTAQFLGVTLPKIRWLDSIQLSKHAWPGKFSKNAKLDYIASDFGIKFQHHDAGEDARVCAEIMIRALNETGKSIEYWLEQTKSTLSVSTYTETVRHDSNGKSIVFTGDLSISRDYA